MTFYVLVGNNAAKSPQNKYIEKVAEKLAQKRNEHKNITVTDLHLSMNAIKRKKRPEDRKTSTG